MVQRFPPWRCLHEEFYFILWLLKAPFPKTWFAHFALWSTCKILLEIFSFNPDFFHIYWAWLLILHLICYLLFITLEALRFAKFSLELLKASFRTISFTFLIFLVFLVFCIFAILKVERMILQLHAQVLSIAKVYFNRLSFTH